MLKNVHLKNLALIKEADIDLGRGLNILTGETGAGKSIILGSINIALGAKASRSFIRSNEEYGLVELIFSADPASNKLLASMDINTDEENIIVTRKISADGSISKINGCSSAVAQLKELTASLVDIHGQHENQKLLNPSNHLKLVDDFGRKSFGIYELKEKVREAYTEFKELKKKYSLLQKDPEELKKEIDFLNYEINEIDEAGLKIGEDESLEEEFKKLSNAQQISAGLKKIRYDLSEAGDSVQARISDALKELEYIIKMDPGMKELKDLLMDADSIVKDAGHDLSGYINDHAFDPERYKETGDRLNEINRLKSRYGNSIEDIICYQNELKSRLQELGDLEKNREKTLREMDRLRKEANSSATELSDKRKAAALILEKKITDNLNELNFLNVDFKIEFSRSDKIYADGFDKVQFMISTNVGEKRKALDKVASGGELSRIMLAVKAAYSDSDKIETMIFDEIDSGISGRTASMVAKKLKALSKDHQIICITHLPQIAAMADRHFLIDKAVEDGSTVTLIRKLDEEGSLKELARLTGGDITESALIHAREMRDSKGGDIHGI